MTRVNEIPNSSLLLVTQESAADIVNNASEFRLRQILLQFGQEKHASRIAKAIVNYRNRVGDISTTMLVIQFSLHFH